MKKKEMIVGIIVFASCIFFIMSYCYMRYFSISQYNITPQKLVESYLEKTYYEKFVLIGTDYYRKRDEYIWEYKFEDENNIEFCVFYIHPYESGNGTYYFFKESVCNIRDFYWQQEVQDTYGRKIMRAGQDFGAHRICVQKSCLGLNLISFK